MNISNLETLYVKDTYNIIANEFDNTRSYLWMGVKEFIRSLPKYSTLLECGCGNGKNNFRNDIYYFGMDLSFSMNQICRQKDIETICSNILNLPYKDNYFDNNICIAVLHHLDSFLKVEKAIKELIRVTSINGKVFIQVWQYNHLLIKSKGNKIKGSNNFLIEWNNPQKTRTFYRYYHLFTEKEIKTILKPIKNIELINIYLEKQNWVIIIKKLL